jgi:hypothetical protein
MKKSTSTFSLEEGKKYSIKPPETSPMAFIVVVGQDRHMTDKGATRPYCMVHMAADAWL